MKVAWKLMGCKLVIKCFEVKKSYLWLGGLDEIGLEAYGM